MKVTSFMIEVHIFKKTQYGIRYLILKRAAGEIYPGLWQMVTGRIRRGEKAYLAALREITEETGLKVKKLWVIPYINSFYAPVRNEVCMIPVFAALADRKSEVRLSVEHSEFRWVKREDALRAFAWHGQRESLKIIHNYFTGRKKVLYFSEINAEGAAAKKKSL